MVWLVALGMALAAVVPSSPIPDEAPTIYALAGNHRLTAGIDTSGNLVQLRWPTLGYWSHMVGPDSSAHWLFVEGATVYSFADGGWDISQRLEPEGTLVTRFDEQDGARWAEQRLYVAEGADVLVVELDWAGFDKDTQCFWYQALNPTTRLVPGVPESVVNKHGRPGFAAYFDDTDGMLVQFRPRAAGHKDWEQAHRLARGHAPSIAWSVFGDGVYWGTFSPGGAQDGWFAPSREQLTETLTGASSLRERRLVGDCFAVLQPRIDEATVGTRRASVYLAVAASGQGLQELRRAMDDDGEGRPASTRPDADVATASPVPPSLAALLACVDQDSGAIVRAPLSYPALAHASIFDSSWAIAALDDYGFHGPAEGALQFHINTLRSDFSPDGLPGSLPAAVFTNGEAAQVLDRANPESSAWLLAATWRHAATMESEMARRFLEFNEARIRDCGDFLARAPVVGGVLSGLLKPGAATSATLQTHYLGLVSAQSIMSFLEKEEPGAWRSRREETYARIRFRQLNPGRVNDRESPWLAYWVTMLPTKAKSNEQAWQVLTPPTGTITMGQLAETHEFAELDSLSEEIPVALRAAVKGLTQGQRTATEE